MWRAILVSTVAAAGVAGCAAQGPQPTNELTRAHTLVDQANKSEAQRYAAADLQRAREELSAADSANNKGDYDAARTYAEAAAVDADVATARGGAGEAEHAANEARQGNSTLGRESRHETDPDAPVSTEPAPPPPPPPAPPPPSPR